MNSEEQVTAETPSPSSLEESKPSEATPLEAEAPANPLEGTPLLPFKVGVVKQYIHAYTVWAADPGDALERVLDGRDAKDKGAEEEQTVGSIVAAIPFGTNPNAINFTEAIKAKAAAQREAAQKAQEASQRLIQVPQIVPPTDIR